MSDIELGKVPSAKELANLYHASLKAGLPGAASIAENAMLKLAAGEASLVEAAALAKFAKEMP